MGRSDGGNLVGERVNLLANAFDAGQKVLIGHYGGWMAGEGVLRCRAGLRVG